VDSAGKVSRTVAIAGSQVVGREQHLRPHGRNRRGPRPGPTSAPGLAQAPTPRAVRSRAASEGRLRPNQGGTAGRCSSGPAPTPRSLVAPNVPAEVHPPARSPAGRKVEKRIRPHPALAKSSPSTPPVRLRRAPATRFPRCVSGW
jgi:hypothetical protein